MKLQSKTTDPDILLIEDNDDDAEIVQSIFKKNNIENILHIKTGEEALDYLLSKDGGSTLTSFPKLVMLDINLPGINGLNVLRRMRANYKTDKLPVFVFTSSTSKQDTFEAYKFGVTSYISKHTSFEKFEEAIMQTEIYLHQYKVLILEDNFSDAEIISYELENSHIDCLCRIARNKAEYTKLLIEFKPDIVFADYDLPPNFDAIQAIRILKGMNLDIPFVLVTGKLAEEFATGCMVEGMDDYLLKGQLRRLPLTLINTLRKKKLETSNNELIKKLQKSETELKNKSLILTEAQRIARLGNWKLDIASGNMTWSDEMYTIYAVSPDIFQPTYDTFLRSIHVQDRESIKQFLEDAQKKGRGCNIEFRIVFNDGTLRFISGSVEPSYDKNGEITSLIGTAQDITERKEAEAERIKTGEIFRLMTENMSDMVAQHSPEGIYLYVSPSSEKILGYKQEELIGVDPYAIMHPDDLEQVRKGIHQKVLSGDIKQRQEYRLKHKNGEYIWVESSASAIFDEIPSNVISLQSITRDITERKKTETKLKQLSQAVEQSPASVVITDTMGNIEYVNQKFIELTGYSAAEAIGKNPRILKSGHTSALEYKKLWKRICSGGEWKGELLNKKKNGELYWESALISPVFNPKGTITHFLAIKEDISKRKEQEIRLREALNRYNILAQATSDTIWDWDITTNVMVYNDGITKMFGYPENEIENSKDWWKEKLHPDDIKKVAESLQEVFEKRLQRVQLTYRYRCADGSYKYIFDRAFVLFDDSGKPTRMIGAMQDITYQVEEEMRMAKAIIDAQEEERRFIGTELHDNVNQILAGAILTFSMINKQIDKNINELVEAGTKHITHAINEIRKLSHKLVPATFSTLSLKDTFENLLVIINLSDQFSIDLQFDEIEKENISNDIKINLYRILQEQLNNIMKHADATAVEIAVTVQPGKSIKMRISDNGKGFETINGKSGIGLNNMKKRAELLSGTLSINSSIGKGCELIVAIPFNHSNQIDELCNGDRTESSANAA